MLDKEEVEQEEEAGAAEGGEAEQDREVHHQHCKLGTAPMPLIIHSQKRDCIAC